MIYWYIDLHKSLVLETRPSDGWWYGLMLSWPCYPDILKWNITNTLLAIYLTLSKILFIRSVSTVSGVRSSGQLVGNWCRNRLSRYLGLHSLQQIQKTELDFSLWNFLKEMSILPTKSLLYRMEHINCFMHVFMFLKKIIQFPFNRIQTLNK